MKADSDPVNLYGEMPKVRRLIAAEIPEDMDPGPKKIFGGQPSSGPEQTMLAVLQGLVNRVEPQIYICYPYHKAAFKRSPEFLWLDYYRKQFGVEVERLKDPRLLLERFGDYVKGVVLYDPKMRNTVNPAVMIAGRQNCLPVTPAMQRSLKKKYGWAANVVDDFRGRFATDYEIALWSHQNLQPSCHRHILMHQPGHCPHNYDFVVAKNLFLFCCCHSMKDRLESALVDRIYQAAERPCHVMGWLDDRTQELEYTARIARNGCFVTCNGRSPNLTVHAGIDAKPKAKLRTLTPPQRVAERKVYVTFVMSDGDALWCLENFHSGVFVHKKRPSLPINWEVQMLAYHLAPGILQYYLENIPPNGYPLASVSGAGYTYPNLHPDPVSYFKLTEQYMQLTGLHYIYSGISDPYRAHYWRDLDSDVERIAELYRKHVPSAKGVIRHYGGGGLLETHSLPPGKTPYVCATALSGRHGGDFACVDKALDSESFRPLFLLIHHTPWGPTVETIEKTIRSLQKRGHEVVLLDEWFAKLEDARDKGWLDDGLYPNRTELLRQSAAGARESWNKAVRKQFETVLKKSLLPPAKLERMHKTFPLMWGQGQPHNERKRTVTTLEDDLAFSVLFTSQVLAAFMASCRGAYMCGLADLARYYAAEVHVKDAAVLSECLTAFVNWEQQRCTIRQAQSWARRMLALVPRLDADMKKAGEGRK